MKYSNTSRTLSFIAHLLIAILFGVPGLYFGIGVVPEYFGKFEFDPKIWIYSNLVKGSYFLYLELAVIGLSLAVMSGYGLYHAIKALQNPRDDEPVVKSFTVLISEGWVAGLFFLLQAVLFFDLTGNVGGGTDNLIFVIIMSLLLAIILLIATNIPMVKLYDGKDQKPLLREFVGALMVVTFFLALESGISLIVNATNDSLNAWKQSEINWLLFVILAMNLVAFVLSFFVYFFLFKKNSKLSGLLSGSAVLSLGVGLIIYGILAIVWRENGIHLNLVQKQGAYYFGESWGYGFMIMSIVVGTITSGLGATLMAMSGKPAKNAA